MAGKWRQLVPHFFAMIAIYAFFVIAVFALTGVQNFWVSLAIALGIALVYPGFARWTGMAPEAWQHDE